MGRYSSSEDEKRRSRSRRSRSRSRDHERRRKSRRTSRRHRSRERRHRRSRSRSPRRDTPEREVVPERRENEEVNVEKRSEEREENSSSMVLENMLDMDKVAKEIEKRRARVEAWRKVQEEMQKKKEKESGEVIQQTKSSGPSWSLDDDNQQEDDGEEVVKVNEGVNDGEDPLDEFMKSIETEAFEQEKMDLKKKIENSEPKAVTWEEIQKMNDDKEDRMSVDDDEGEFIQAMKEIQSKGIEKSEAEKGGRDFDFEDGIPDDGVVARQESAVTDGEPRPGAMSITLGKKELKRVDHSKMDYTSFRKDFYVPTRSVQEMTMEDIKKLRKDMSLHVRGKNCPPPIREWYEAGVSEKILDALAKYEYKNPFPIQSQAIPAVMSGRDVIGIAETGSGKTLGFVLPMLRHITDQPPRDESDGPIALIMSPTRELAMQIYREAKRFTDPLGLIIACMYGGAPVAEQIAQLKRGADVIVCTPGRMIDLLCANRGKVTNLKRVTYVVLDEADRMFDLGFEPQIRRVLENIRPDRQTVMFSATFPTKIERIAKQVLKKPTVIISGGRSLAAVSVKQHIEVLEEEQKFKRLLQLLGTVKDTSCVLVFVRRQEDADDLFSQLLKHGYPSLSLHGGMDQTDRDTTIVDFKNKIANILVATSVAARGIHVDQLDLVVNYDSPDHYEDYVHRVGRTGRAGRKGTAYTFLTPDDDTIAPDLVKAFQRSNIPVPEALEKLSSGYEAKFESGTAATKYGGYGGSGYKFDEEEERQHKEEQKAQQRAYRIEHGEVSDSDDELFVAAEEDDESAIKRVEGAMPSLGSQGFSFQGGRGVSNETRALAIARAKAAAAALSIQSSLAKDSQLSHFQSEFEINDLPQDVRWRILQKERMADLQDLTSCAVTCKGEHVAGHKKRMKPGQRKLYLLMEGPTQEAVAAARREIRGVIEEGLQKLAVKTEQRGGPIGRYSVV